MTIREELEDRLSTARSNAKAAHERVARLEAELAALPAEPVRLRASVGGCIYAGTAEGHEYSARVFVHDCERGGIDYDDFMKYLLRYGQPDPRDAQLAAADALAEAAIGFCDDGTHSLSDMRNALTAYRTAREVAQ